MFDAFVAQTGFMCYVLCVPGYGPMQYAVYVFMLVDMFMLCDVQLVPDFGPMQGARPQLVRTSVRCSSQYV